jgi:hypothetical protein
MAEAQNERAAEAAQHAYQLLSFKNRMSDLSPSNEAWAVNNEHLLETMDDPYDAADRAFDESKDALDTTNKAIASDTTITKGAQTGHHFYGNQWSVGQTNGATHATAPREESNVAVNDMMKKIGKLRTRMLYNGTRGNDLNRLSLLHSALAGIHVDRGDNHAADLNFKASDEAHRAYIKTLIATNGDGKAYLFGSSDIPTSAHMASNEAQRASYNTMLTQ